MEIKDLLARYKENESIEDVLPLTDTKDLTAANLRKLVVAWPKIRIEIVPRSAKETPPEEEKKLWSWLWKQIGYDTDELKKNLRSETGNRAAHGDPNREPNHLPGRNDLGICQKGDQGDFERAARDLRKEVRTDGEKRRKKGRQGQRRRRRRRLNKKL